MPRIPPRAILVAAGIGAVLVILGLCLFGPIVRARVAKEAAKRKLEITVGSVRPGFFAVRLRDVRVKPIGVPGVEAHFDDLRVELSAGLSVREIVSHGGDIRLDGEPEELAERLAEFRRSGGGGEREGSKGHRTPFTFDGLQLTWKLPSGGEISATGARASRSETGTKLGSEGFLAKYRDLSLDVTHADIELAPDNVPRRIAVTSMSVAHEPPRVAAPTAGASARLAEPVPPPLPPVAKGRAGKKEKAKDKAVAAPATPDGPLLPLPDLHAARTRIATLAAALAPRLADGSVVDIGGLSIKFDVGGEAVAFGPGVFSLSRRDDRVHVAYATEKDKPGTPLSIDAELPLGQGDVVAHLSGGPVSLAVLGVQEGMKGLMDVGRGAVSGKGQLVLSAAGDALTFDGQLALRSITVQQPRLASEPLRNIDFAVAARGVIEDKGRLRLDDAQLDMGALHLKTHGTLEESSDHLALSLGLDVAPAACQALLESTPQGLLPTVRSTRLSGTFGATARVAFDTRTIDKLLLEYRVDDACRIVEVPSELSRERFSDVFTYRTYHPDGTAGETRTGPGTASWTNIEDISPFLVAALLTTEDGAFYKHHGFNHAAIRGSVQANLKARRFVRGASTITMQLAKNLFLSRQKTLSRKIEEVILTDYLEQIFHKEDMMELYLNVVEFGPDVYGVTQAADHYFGRKPEELNLAECFFLASLLPSPIRFGKLRDKGQVPETWLSHLRALMEIAAKNGKISRAELAEGLGEEVVFVRPGDPRPEPRKPIRGSRRDGADDAAWQPVD